MASKKKTSQGSLAKSTKSKKDRIPNESIVAEPPSPDDRAPFPIVGIGASAGGLAAYEAFFAALPANPGVAMAFVLVQHLSPDHKSMLSDLIGRYTKMQVQEAQDGVEVRPNHVYIIPPNRDMELQGNKLHLFPPTERRGQRLPIDIFFRSLAREQHDSAICVVLSGTGSDGTLGVRAVKGEGGMAMVQEPSTTEHDGMPLSAIATDLVDYVLPPADMPAQIIAYTRHAFKQPAPPKTRPPDEGTLKRLASLLRAQTGHDFSQYKATTLMRRMERRMALHQLDAYDEYFTYARENPAEIEGLFRDLLIGVTSFFRDPEAFKILEEKVIPQLLRDKASHDQVRVWVCGCSTGEEAYSIAIAMQERMEQAKQSTKVQVFATDIDHLAIEQARAGTYPASIVADVSKERLARFFVHDPERDAYKVQKAIRDMLVFSEQDVIRDPPFSKLDLISCRNVLIYLNQEVQRKLIPLFHYALNPGGALFLGTSETVGEFSRLFTPVDRKWKLYTRERGDTEHPRIGLSEFVTPLREPRERHRPVHHGTADPVSSWRHLTEQALLTHYAESGILVNSRGDILYILGKTGKYLEPAAGDAALNIIAMAREGLRRVLTTALHKAVAHKQPTSYRSIRVRVNGGHVTADLTVRPVEVHPGGNSDLYLVVLEEAPTLDPSGEDGTDGRNEDFDSRVAELEQELKAKEDYLQTTLEEMETTNEELKSTNEEMQSVNEELQSTNEELETSKEELQSVNEELSTVNAELQDKVADLSRVNNDMNNLLAGTGVGTVFVDNQLRIMRFTPAATQVINLIQSDVGRPVDHIVPNLVGYHTLIEDVRSVLDTLIPKETEVQAKSGAAYLMRIRPYRTMENTIEGAVLTFVDISERKRAEEKLRKSEERFHAIFNQAFAGVTQTDLHGRFTFVNGRFCEMTGYTEAELLQTTVLELTHDDDVARTRVLLNALAVGGSDFSIEKRYRRRDGSVVWVSDRASGVREADGTVTSAVIVSIDLSERKQLEREAASTDARLTHEIHALSRLEGISMLTITETNREDVFNEILDTAMVMTRGDKATLQLRSGEGGLRVVASHGFEQPWIDFWDAAPVGSGSCGAALERGERVVVEDVTKSPFFVGTPALDVQLAAGVRSVMSAPLIPRSGKVLGAISTHSSELHRPDPRTTRMFDILARQVADLIERGTPPMSTPHRGRGQRTP